MQWAVDSLAWQCIFSLDIQQNWPGFLRYWRSRTCISGILSGLILSRSCSTGGRPRFLDLWSSRGTSWSQTRATDRSWTGTVRLCLSETLIRRSNAQLPRSCLLTAAISRLGSRCRWTCSSQPCGAAYSAMVTLSFHHLYHPPVICSGNTVPPYFQFEGLYTRHLWTRNCSQMHALSELSIWASFGSTGDKQGPACTTPRYCPLQNPSWTSVGFQGFPLASDSRNRSVFVAVTCYSSAMILSSQVLVA